MLILTEIFKNFPVHGLLDKISADPFSTM